MSKIYEEDIYRFIYHSLDKIGQVNNTKYSDHLSFILSKIKNKIYDGKKPESRFVELVVNEKWEEALYIADNFNKHAINNYIFHDFLIFIKKSPEYIEYKRSEKLNSLLDI